MKQMPPPQTESGRARQSERDRRRADALRANLIRRKARPDAVRPEAPAGGDSTAEAPGAAEPDLDVHDAGP